MYLFWLQLWNCGVRKSDQSEFWSSVLMSLLHYLLVSSIAVKKPVAVLIILSYDLFSLSRKYVDSCLSAVSEVSQTLAMSLFSLIVLGTWWALLFWKRLSSLMEKFLSFLCSLFESFIQHSSTFLVLSLLLFLSFLFSIFFALSLYFLFFSLSPEF